MQEVKDPFDYILPHLVSIGSISDGILLPPSGSGTFIKFTVSINGTQIELWGIATAIHVLEEINFAFNKNLKGELVGLTKPSDRLGNSYSAFHGIKFIFCDFDKKHYRELVQGHEASAPDRYLIERDIAFICLGIGSMPGESDLIKNSLFYDLDINPLIDLPKKHDQPYVFFRGACLDNEAQDNRLSTELIIEYGGTIKRYPKSGIIYHEIPNTKNRSIKGASGTGLWMFCENRSDEIIKTLKGIIVAGNQETTHAIDISYIYDDFLPKLKKFMISNVSLLL